jgi:NADP-dependent 3-hydroxy acid dehydrogenase YdfG
MGRLDGKCIIVSGAAAGFGRGVSSEMPAEEVSSRRVKLEAGARGNPLLEVEVQNQGVEVS